LVLAAAFFVGIHVGIAGTRVRDALTTRLGEQAYLGLFSLASLAGMIWLTTAYGGASYVAVWGRLAALRPLALPVVLVAFVLAVLGLTTPSPTVVGGEKMLEAAEPATGIQRVTRHPFLWGVAIWAAMHLVVNGNLRALVLFGSLLFLGLYGPVSIDAKRARRFGAAWERYAAVTSNVPFAAIAERRNRLRFDEIGWGRVTFAVVVFATVLLMHPILFGGNPLGFLGADAGVSSGVKVAGAGAGVSGRQGTGEKNAFPPANSASSHGPKSQRINHSTRASRQWRRLLLKKASGFCCDSW